MRNHRAIFSNLNENCPNCQFRITGNIRFISDVGSFAARGEYFRFHVAAGFGPLVVCSASTAPTTRMMESRFVFRADGRLLSAGGSPNDPDGADANCLQT
jgi:hypothetical protein